MDHPKYSPNEIVTRGKELYETRVRPQVEQGNKGKIVVIDIETGDYVLGDDSLATTHAALARHPGAALFATRVGYPTLARIGGAWGDDNH